MTSGTLEQGNVANGYYRKRTWSGSDGNHSEEHGYSFSVKESYLLPIKYRKAGTTRLWLTGSMFTFRPGLPQSGVDHTINLVNCANQKVWGDLAQSDFHLGVFSGEFKETYQMMCMLVRRLAKGISLTRRGHWSRAFEVLASDKWRPSMTGTAADTYMMVHFGILPLLSDIENAYKFLRTHYKTVKRVRRHCVFKDGKVISYNHVNWNWELKALVEVRGEVEMIELSEADRLGLYDLAGVAWELTKLSWMVDWLIPIGNFLSAVNASNKTQGANFAMTRMQKELLGGPSSDGYWEFKNFQSDAFSKFYPAAPLNSRVLLTALPWSFPTIQNPLGDNLSRWVTSVAYLRQVVGR